MNYSIPGLSNDILIIRSPLLQRWHSVLTASKLCCFLFLLGQHIVKVNHSMVHSASWLWSQLFPTEEPRPWLISAVALLSYQRHPGLYLPLSRSSALLEGASIPPTMDASGSSTWPLSAFLGKLCPLSCGQLYISSGLAPGLEVWNMVFMLILSFLFFYIFFYHFWGMLFYYSGTKWRI